MSKPRLYFVVLLVSGLWLGAGAYVGPAYSDGDDVPGTPSQIEMPAVLGAAAGNAEARLRELGLEVERVTIAGPRAGVVARQAPDAGALVRVGQRVVIHVGIAPGVKTVVPDLVGLTEGAARAAAEGAYVVDVRTVSGSASKAGTVVGQDPNPGRHYPLRGVIELEIVLKTLVVPTLIGRTAEESGALLDRLGLVLEARYVADARTQDGEVFAQEPRTGAEILPGGVVSVQIAGDPRFDSHLVVPDLRGRMLGDAQRRIVELDLVPNVDIEQTDAYAHMTVIRQSQAPGTTLEPGEEVNFVVALASRLPGWAHVPLFLGMDQADARRFATRLGLRVEVRFQESPLDAGVVLAQDPRLGVRVATGERIVLVASRSPDQSSGATARMPRVVGLTSVQARTLLLAAGIRTRTIRVYAPDRPVDQVVAQSVSAGRDIPVGTEVRLSLPLTTVVPRVLNVRPSRADDLLQLSKLRADARGPARGVGARRVTRQWIAAGTRVSQGTIVPFDFEYTGVVHTHAVVPAVIGLSRDDALRRIRAVGLRASERGPDGFGRTRVVAQSIMAGTEVRMGTTVAIHFELVVGRMPENATVPDLSGLPLYAAETRLRSRGLALGIAVIPGNRNAVVSGQSPAAGMIVPMGGLVNVRLVQAVPAASVRVPNIVGARVDHAREALRRAGLVGEFIGPAGARSKQVVAQSPRAGATAARGSRVRAQFRSIDGVAVIMVVPDVRGMTKHKASERLRASGFKVQISGMNINGLGMKSRVKEQVPQPGVLAQRGTKVVIRLGL